MAAGAPGARGSGARWTPSRPATLPQREQPIWAPPAGPERAGSGRAADRYRRPRCAAAPSRRCRPGSRARLVTAVLALAAIRSRPPATAASMTFTPCPGHDGLLVRLAAGAAGPRPGTCPARSRSASGASWPGRSRAGARSWGWRADPGRRPCRWPNSWPKGSPRRSSNRDLLVFDQRGTGSSSPLALPGAWNASRRFDLEAVRTVRARDRPRAGGLHERGKRPRHRGPAHRRGLRKARPVRHLLRHQGGSRVRPAVPPERGSAAARLRRPGGRARTVRDPELPGAPGCGARTLRRATRVPGSPATRSADLAALNARLRHHAISGSVYDGKGRRHPATIDEPGLLRTIEAGDVNPALRALLPAAMRSALDGDPDPLLRLHVLSEGLIPTLPKERQVESTEDIDEALFATTTCEESPFPWSRSAPAATRLAEAHAFLEAQPGSYFYPFDAATAYSSSLLEACAAWPDASPAPPAEGAAARRPHADPLGHPGPAHAHLQRAPGGGRDTGRAWSRWCPSPATRCSAATSANAPQHAVAAFFSGQTVRPAPPPPTPSRRPRWTPPASAGCAPRTGSPGRPGRTLVAALDAIVDLSRQVVGATLQADTALPSGSSFGGLRGGYATLASGAVVLHGFSFVPGVDLSGRLAVSGQGVAPAAAAGQRLAGLGRQRAPQRRPQAGQRHARRSQLPAVGGQRETGRAWAAANGRRPHRSGAGGGQRPSQRELALPAPARREPGGLAAVGRRGVRTGARAGQARDRLDRLLLLPLVPCDGAGVLRGPRHGGADERQLRVREGGPRGASRRGRPLHGGPAEHERTRRLAAERVPHARAAAVLRRHLLPARAPRRDARPGGTC